MSLLNKPIKAKKRKIKGLEKHRRGKITQVAKNTLYRGAHG